MNKLIPYTLVGTLAFATITALVFFPPVEESDGSVIWNKKWEIIEFGDTRLIRKGGLFGQDSFWIQRDPRGEPRSRSALRRAGYNAANLFHDWEKPRSIGIYDKDEAGSAPGITAVSREIRLYEREGARPIVLKIGKKIQGGYFSHFDLPEIEGFYFILPVHLVQHFDQPAISFREKRVLEYRPDEMIESIVLDATGNRSYSLRIDRQITEGDTTRWFRSDGGAVSSEHASALERALQDLRIETFGDEKSSPYDSLKLWGEALGGPIAVQIRIGKKEETTIGLREHRVNGRRIGMLSHREGEIDFINPAQMDRIVQAAQILLKETGK